MSKDSNRTQLTCIQVNMWKVSAAASAHAKMSLIFTRNTHFSFCFSFRDGHTTRAYILTSSQRCPPECSSDIFFSLPVDDLHAFHTVIIVYTRDYSSLQQGLSTVHTHLLRLLIFREKIASQTTCRGRDIRCT